MKPCSYFLPKSYLSKLQVDNEDKSLVECCMPVFSHKFDYVHHFTCDHLYKITTSDSGRGILFAMKEVKELSTLVCFREYKFSNNSIIPSKQRMLNIEHTYNHRVYDSDKGVCFFFNYQQFSEETCTRIYIRYAMVGDSDDYGTVKKAFTLEYKQLFNKYCCVCSVKENMLVVVTSNQPGLQEQVSYMDLLSYEIFTKSRVRIKHNVRRNVTEVTQLNRSINGNEVKSLQANYFNKIYSTCDGKKLILVCPNKCSVIVYSISDDVFGPVCNFQQNIITVQCFDDYFYVYHKDYGDVLLMCNQEGMIRVARENNLKMKLLEEKTLSLSDFGFFDETFDFLHVDCFDDILIFVLASHCNELFVISLFQKSVLCKYFPQQWNEPDADIIDVTTNWSGEEVFVFLCKADGKFELDIICLKKKKESCLKELSKMAVLQTYSVKDLMEMNLPKRLREEMKLL